MASRYDTDTAPVAAEFNFSGLLSADSSFTLPPCVTYGAAVVDNRTPSAMPNFRPLEPTHLVCSSVTESSTEFAADLIRTKIAATLAEQGCVILETHACGWTTFAEVYVNYEATSFVINVFSGTNGARGSRQGDRVDQDASSANPTIVVEWKKFNGCTLAFCDTYRDFARKWVHEGISDALRVHDPSGFANTDKSYAEQQRVGGPGETYTLPTDPDEIRDTCAPVFAMLESEWSTSQREGCCTVALITRNKHNAKQLLASAAELIKCLNGFLRSRDRHAVRCAAAALGNLAKSADHLSEPVREHFQDTLVILHELQANCSRQHGVQASRECETASVAIQALL